EGRPPSRGRAGRPPGSSWAPPWRSSLLDLSGQGGQPPPGLAPAGQLLPLLRAGLALRPHPLDVRAADVLLAEASALAPEPVVVGARRASPGAAAAGAAAAHPLGADHAGQRLG